MSWWRRKWAVLSFFIQELCDSLRPMGKTALAADPRGRSGKRGTTGRNTTESDKNYHLIILTA
jgi:hypothetical protein